MRDNYDFSGAERGKFYRENAVLVPPVHLDADLSEYYRKRAEERGISLNELLNGILRRDMETIDAAE